MFLVHYLLVASLIGSSFSQLFPFSNIRPFFEHKNAESSAGSNKQKTVERPYRHLEDEKFVTHIPEKEIIVATHIDSTTEEEKSTTELVTHVNDEDTVIVTPRPKYKPNNFVPEPSTDPNSVRVPSIGYKPTIRIKKRRRKIKPVEKKNNVETLLITPTSPVKALVVKTPTESKLLIPHGSETTIVESIPSLSITISQTSHKNHGIPDYLTPPKNIPSIYNSDVLKEVTEESSLEIVNLKPPRPFSKAKKPQSKNKPVNPNHSERETVSEKKLRTVRRPSVGKRNRYQSDRTLSPEPYRGQVEEYSNRKSFEPQRDGPKHFEEQITSETSYIRSKKPSTRTKGERVEFQMHGQNGPHSYKFGYDTGKGHSRQFRYEEKDHEGNVKGHYGFYDKSGKLKIVNYRADKNGFYADPS